MPRTRNSAKKATDDRTSDAVADENRDAAAPSTTKRLSKRRRTKSSTGPTITIQPTVANTPPAATKKARIAGPPRGRPMQLVLPRESDTVVGNEPLDVGDNVGVTRALRPNDVQPRPRHGGATTCSTPTPFTNPNPGAEHIEGYLTGGETEEEWLDDAQLAGVSARFARAEGDENSSDDDITTPGVISRNISSGDDITSVGSAATSQSQNHRGGSGPDTAVVPDPAQVAGSDDTDIIFMPGTTKVSLTNQRPLLRAVIQEAIENLRCSLLVNYGFPNANVIPSIIRASLIAAAETHSPEALQIRARLLNDREYLEKMIRLPRARIPLFRGEIKDRCSVVIHASFLAIGSTQLVKEVVIRQLDDYNYTFPRAVNANPLTGPPVRTRPYRNDRIISVIRDLFFSGGLNSYAHRFDQHFPTFQNRNGITAREVPAAMVALVGTALYAAIRQWHKGTYEAIEFSASTYVDVYNGHVNTLRHIEKGKNATFHSMLADIYSQASGNVASAVPIANLDLDQLED